MAHDTPSAPDRTLRVLVADDHDLIRGGLVTLLRGAPGFDVAGEAASGEEAVRISEATTPDVVLMDVRMPGAGGIAATRRILSTGGDQPPRVLILTTFDLDEYVYEALRAGASGFLLKDTPSRRLLSAIATVAGGEMLFAPTVVRRLIEWYTEPVPPHPGRPPQLAAVTTREIDVLRLVGKGLSNEEIAADLEIAEATVKTHLNRAMAKLGITSRAQVVVLAYETGLVVPERARRPAGPATG